MTRYSSLNAQKMRYVKYRLACRCFVMVLEKWWVLKKKIIFPKSFPFSCYTSELYLWLWKSGFLGKYLGVLVLQGRITESTYAYILDKVRSNLQVWKISKISMASRLTLIKSVLAVIPLYAMQTTMLLDGLCQELDKVIRQFLWGSTLEARRIHNVKWDTVCLWCPNSL